MLAKVIFAVALADARLAREIEARVEALERFYSPLALGAAHTRAENGALIGAIGHGEELVWGERPDLNGTGAEISVSHGAVTITSSASGPATLYEASADGVHAWSSHALAAGWLARGRVELDPTAIPELLAFDFVGGGRTLFKRVRAVPAATRVHIPGDAACWWHAKDRWEPVPEAEAQADAERALLETLDARLRNELAISLALTAGMDSLVVALALRELGLSATAFTWGEHDWDDVEGAQRVAERVGFEHRFTPPAWQTEDDARAALERGARFADGVFPLAAAERTWPPDASAVIGGMGGETGRAFYYGPWATYLGLDLTRPFNVKGRIAGAAPEAVARAEQSLREWIDEARAIAGDGWRALDVLYAEQRVRYWGRSQLPCVPQTVMGAFTPVPVARALSSLPLEARLAGSFPHEFARERAPELAPPPKGLPRRPGALRRVLLRRRHRPTRTPDPGNELTRRVWGERRGLRDWVAYDVLEHPLIVDTMGSAWAARTRAGFLEGRSRATAHALLACGPVTVANAIETNLRV